MRPPTLSFPVRLSQFCPTGFAMSFAAYTTSQWSKNTSLRRALRPHNGKGIQGDGSVRKRCALLHFWKNYAAAAS